MLTGNEGVHKQKEDGRRGQCEHNSIYKWKRLRDVCATLAFSSQASVSGLTNNAAVAWIEGGGNDSEKNEGGTGDVVPASRLEEIGPAGSRVEGFGSAKSDATGRSNKSTCAARNQQVPNQSPRFEFIWR